VLLGYSSGGGSRVGGPELAKGQRADSWVAQDVARHALMCLPERETEKKRERKKEKLRACTAAFTTVAQPFSPPHLLPLLLGPFLV